jgi:SAM-dependent methyltransferase
LGTTDERFDLAFSSLGATGWLPDLDAWARGVERVLVPGGAFVYVEFHPAAWSFDKELALKGDDYFAEGIFREPVGDYVLESGAALGVVTEGPSEPNTIPATAWQHGMGKVLDALARAGLVLERVREHPYSNGCRLLSRLVPDPTDARRWVFPEGVARVPLMYGLRARKPR